MYRGVVGQPVHNVGVSYGDYRHDLPNMPYVEDDNGEIRVNIAPLRRCMRDLEAWLQPRAEAAE